MRWVRGLAAAAVKKGARIHESTRVDAVGAGEARTASGTSCARARSCCAPTRTPRTSRLRESGRCAGRCSRRRRPHRSSTRPAYANRGYRYWRQTSDGRVLVGGWRDTAADEEVGEEERTTERIQTQLEAFPARARRHCRRSRTAGPARWGSRTTRCRTSVASPRVMFVCGGFTGHGMAFGPASAELVAALVRGSTHPDAELFDPSATSRALILVGHERYVPSVTGRSYPG